MIFEPTFINTSAALPIEPMLPSRYLVCQHLSILEPHLTKVGETEIDAGMFMEYLQAQGRDRFRGDRSFFDLVIVTQPKAYPVTIQQYILHCIRTIWNTTITTLAGMTCSITTATTSHTRPPNSSLGEGYHNTSLICPERSRHLCSHHISSFPRLKTLKLFR